MKMKNDFGSLWRGVKNRSGLESQFLFLSLNGAAGRPTLHTAGFVLNRVEGRQGFSAVIAGCLQLFHTTIIKKKKKQKRKTIDADAI